MSHFGRFPPRGGMGAPVRAFDGKASVMTQNRQVKEAATIRLHSKTFAAWVNVHLRKRDLRVEDVTRDFADGLLLIQLVEQLTGQSCPLKYNPAPRLEIQKVENVSVALQFINRFTKMNINPKDVVSGNSKIILAILWRLIVTFQISKKTSSQPESSSAAVMKREAKEQLLAWVNEKTGAQVKDCDRSFDDGILFCLLVHAYDNSLIDISQLNPNYPRENLQYAFQMIEQHLGIPQMLSPEDMVLPDLSSRPDEQCIMTYLSQFPEAFLQRPTPHPMDANVEFSPLGEGGAGQGQEYVSPTDSLSSHPSLAHMEDSSRMNDRSQSSFPQPPASQESQMPPSRYSVGDDLPLPPTVRADNFRSQPEQPAAQHGSGSFGTGPSSGAGYGSQQDMAPPQRPPPPRSDFLSNNGTPDFSSFGSQAPPQRPPPPSNFEAFGLPNQNVQGSPNPNPYSSYNGGSMMGGAPAPAEDPEWRQRELELQRREEEFRRQQEEFLKQKEKHEQEMDALRRQSSQGQGPPQSDEIERLQGQLSRMRESTVAKLRVEVMAARNLMPGALTGVRDPYAVVIVENQKEKTTTLKKTVHPTWNVEFNFYVENPNWTLNIFIYDRNKLTHDDFLGKVVIPIKQLKEGARREEWLTLQPKKAGAIVSGEIRLGLTLSR